MSGRARSASSSNALSLEHEVAHRMELEAALRESLAREKSLREDAERNVRFAEMFCGMLRNPLGTITMGATYIARSNLGDKPTRTATRISTAAERMARMIDQLLDFTRIRAAGGLELHRTRTDLVSICDRVREEIEVIADVRNQGTIDAEMLPVIFDPFRGMKRHNAKGLGLGLYITRQTIPFVFTTSDPARAPAGELIMKKPVNFDVLLNVVRKCCA